MLAPIHPNRFELVGELEATGPFDARQVRFFNDYL
jgi:hypothetical protein